METRKYNKRSHSSVSNILCVVPGVTGLSPLPSIASDTDIIVYQDMYAEVYVPGKGWLKVENPVNKSTRVHWANFDKPKVDVPVVKPRISLMERLKGLFRSNNSNHRYLK